MRFRRVEQPLKLDGPDAARDFFSGCFVESDPAHECLWVAHVDQWATCIHLSRHEGDACTLALPVRKIIADVTRFAVRESYWRIIIPVAILTPAMPIAWPPAS
jgi:DNA repair protein RadC